MLLLIRGAPHSGKTQMARALQGIHNWVHIEAEMAFTTSNGELIIDQKMLESAKIWCVAKTKKLLLDGYNVVVSDTLPKHADIRPYLDFCSEHSIHCQIIKLGNVNGGYEHYHTQV